MENTAQNIYKSLVRMFLPEYMLDYFEVVRFEEELTGKMLFGNWPEKILHIYLDEKDSAHCPEDGYKPNGYTEETLLNDFTIRDRKAVLHVRRRRWIDPEGHNEVLDYGELIGANGTKLSRELAAFLKATHRQ